MNKTTSTSPAGELGTITRRLAVVGAVTLACLGAAGTQEAHADRHGDLDVRPYAGVGMEYVSFDLDTPADFTAPLFADSYLGVNLHLGARFGEWFGAELGFFQTQTEKHSTTAEQLRGEEVKVTTEGDLRGVYVDLLGYLPIADEGTDLIGSIGLSRVTFDATFELSHTPTGYTTGDLPIEKQTETVTRFGFGIQHHINENLAVRALYRRHQSDDIAGGHANGVHLGLNYHF